MVIIIAGYRKMYGNGTVKATKSVSQAGAWETDEESPQRRVP
jgi:hypothetical protein